jgi:hypothetical protein
MKKQPGLFFILRKFCRVAFLIMYACLLCQCTHAPVMDALRVNPEIEKDCLSVFPSKPFRAVHKIEADLPFGGYETFIGVTEIHPDTGLIKIILLSPEGITLLDAECRGLEITINSGIPPLDKKDFAAGLLDDIRFLFMPPKGNLEGALNNNDSSCLCVWTKDNLRTEILKEKDRTIISDIKGRTKITRQAVLMPPVIDGLFSKMTLQKKGISGYRLNFELLQTEDTGN